MKRSILIAGAVISSAGLASADLLVTHLFNTNRVSNNTLPIDSETNVYSTIIASDMTLAGSISQSITSEPNFSGSALNIKDNDLDTSVTNAETHGVKFTLTPNIAGESISITNVNVRIYSAATNFSWSVGVFAKAATGSEVKLGELTLPNGVVAGNNWYSFNTASLSAPANDAVTVRLDFADANGLGANYSLQLSQVDVYGTVIPEPATIGLFGSSALLVLLLRRLRVK